MHKKRILGISGSTKAKSSNKAMLRYLAQQYADQIDLEIWDGIDKIPHFNPDLDNETPPETIADFRNKIEEADGVLICTPEYVFSLPGSLKNALDWLVSTVVFSEKPTAMIVAAASGEKAFESLSLILRTIQAKMPDTSKLLIKGGEGKVNAEGELIDPKTIQNLQTVMISLMHTIEDENPN